MSGPFNRSGVNTGGTGQVFSDDTYSDVNTGGSGQLFPSEQYSTEERVAGEIYTLQINEGILELVDSQGNIAGTYTLPTVTDDRTGAINTGPFAFDGVVIGNNGGLEFSIHDSHGQHGNFAAHLQERIGTGVVVTTVLDDENNVITTDPGEEPITAAAVAAMGRELVSDNRVADSYPAESDEFLLTAGGIVEAIGALSGEGDHITTTGTGDYVTGVTVNEAGNVTNLTLNDGDTVLRNIGAQQTIDGVFFASTAAQRAMDPPRGELAFYANVGGTPTREHTQPLEVIGMRGSGTAVHTFDDGASLWFEVEIVGAGEGGGGTVVFATSDAWEAQDGLTLQLDEYVSTDEDYVPVRADAELRAAGYEAGDSFFIVQRDIEYQVIITSENFALQYVISNRDGITELSGGQGVLDDISANTTGIATNTADIESVVQHNHEQDARIAALENQDFTTTISSFTESTTLSNLFTSGTIINKGNAGSNLYQAWTVTREGHELIGYLQLTDTERDSFRNEFSLIQGSSSNIYIPANPDSPHTIGIKAFPAADFNDLSSSTQVMLGQISSMRFGGNVGSETMFEIRWELLNYSDDIDTGLGTVDSGEIYGAAGDKRYAFLAPTIYTAPVWEFREATVSRTEVITTGTDNALRTAPATVANDDAWLAYINGLGISGGSTIRVDSVEVEDPNFVDNAISTTTARGVAFGADAQGNIIGQVDVTGLSGMGESALAGNTAGGLVKVNATQDGFDDAIAGTDYQAPLTAGTDYQTPLVAGTDYQIPITGPIVAGVADTVPADTWTTAQVENLDEMLTALGVTDPSNIGLFVDGQAYRIGDNFVEANTLYRVLSAGAYASFDAIIAANAATAIGTFTINQTNNTFNSVTFTATVTDDAGTSVNLSNISYDTPTTTITVTGTTESGGGGVISSLTIDIGAAARAAVAGTPINLSATSTVNDSIIITQELVDVAVDTGDFVIVDNVLQINNGITSPGFVSFVRVNGFLGVRQEASDDTRDIYIVSYRGATHTVYFFKADSTWRSSDSTTDNTNIITPLIGG